MRMSRAALGNSISEDTLAPAGDWSYNDLHRYILMEPPYRQKTVSGVGSVLVEVKTVGAKRMRASIIEGIRQLQDNKVYKTR